MPFNKLFSIIIGVFILWLTKFLIVDYFGYGWAGYGKFTFYFAAILYAIAFLLYAFGGLLAYLSKLKGGK